MLVTLVFFVLWHVYCLLWFALPLGVADSLCTVIVVLPAHLFYYFF